MRRFTLTPLLLLTALAGCHGRNDRAIALGRLGMLGYHIAAGADTALPAGDIGYLVTANGQGGYSLFWTDTLNSPAQFTGRITCDTDFQQVQAENPNESVSLSSDRTTIDFNSVPGQELHGVTFVSSTDPVYVDLLVDGSRTGFNIYFTGADTGRLLTSAFDPVAFTSP